MLPTAEGRLQKLAKSQMVHHQYLIAYSCKSPSHLELVLWSLLASPVGLVKKGKTKKNVASGLPKAGDEFLSLPSFWDRAQSHLHSDGEGRPPLLYRNTENTGFVLWHLLLSHPACYISALVFQ